MVILIVLLITLRKSLTSGYLGGNFINFEPNLKEILNFEYILSLEINFLIIIISQLISIIRVMFAFEAIT